MNGKNSAQPLLVFKPLFWSTDDNVIFTARTHMGDIEIRPSSIPDEFNIYFYFKNYMYLKASDLEAAQRLAEHARNTNMMDDLIITSYQRKIV